MMQRAPEGIQLLFVALLGLLSPPLLPFWWALFSGDARGAYLRSGWMRASLIVFALASLPLLVVSIAASLGLTRDPNPNPIGLGLFFVAGLFLCVILASIGCVVTWVRLGREGH
jgi:hypothetical protein